MTEQKPVSGYTGWLLDEDSRNMLLQVFPPMFPDVIAHHITAKFPAMSNEPIPNFVSAKVIGKATDNMGVQALVVSIDGKSSRPDGGFYHITWSIDKKSGRKAVDSNNILKNGFSPCRPITINVTPMFFRN